MNGYANVLLTSLLSWMQGAARSLWRLITGEGGGMLAWIAENWLLLAVLLCVAGLLVDAVVYLARWRPHLVWASFFRRLRRRRDERESGGRVRRWVYADGRARMERVAAEEAPHQPYMAVMQPPAPAYEAQEDEPEAPEQEPPQAEQPRVRRNRRAQRHAAENATAGKRLAQLLAPPEDEEALPRYRPGPLPVSKDEAYHKPYIPPQWKNPGDQRDLPG